MAYVSKELAQRTREALKAVNKKYSMKTSLRVDNHSELVCTLISGSIDFGTDRDNVNHYWIDTSEKYSKEAKDYLNAIHDVLHLEHWDKSDIREDYFNCAYYVSIQIGNWQKPYLFIGKSEKTEEI